MRCFDTHLQGYQVLNSYCITLWHLSPYFALLLATPQWPMTELFPIEEEHLNNKLPAGLGLYQAGVFQGERNKGTDDWMEGQNGDYKHG